MIPKFINLLLRNESCPLHGSGDNRRSYLYVEDVARAFDVILHRGSIGSVYNIGSEIELENRVVLNKLISIFRQRNLLKHSDDSYYIRHVQDRAFNDFRYHIDSDAVNALGWQRKYSDFDSALHDTVEWYLNQCRPDHWTNIDRALAPHPHFNAKTTVAKNLATVQDIDVGIGSGSNNTNKEAGYINISRSTSNQNISGDDVQNNANNTNGNLYTNSISNNKNNNNNTKSLKWLIYGQDGYVYSHLIYQRKK